MQKIILAFYFEQTKHTCPFLQFGIFRSVTHVALWSSGPVYIATPRFKYTRPSSEM